MTQIEASWLANSLLRGSPFLLYNYPDLCGSIQSLRQSCYAISLLD
jgi:hypothetical protein